MLNAFHFSSLYTTTPNSDVIRPPTYGLLKNLRHVTVLDVEVWDNSANHSTNLLHAVFFPAAVLGEVGYPMATKADSAAPRKGRCFLFSQSLAADALSLIPMIRLMRWSAD